MNLHTQPLALQQQSLAWQQQQQQQAVLQRALSFAELQHLRQTEGLAAVCSRPEVHANKAVVCKGGADAHARYKH